MIPFLIQLGIALLVYGISKHLGGPEPRRAAAKPVLGLDRPRVKAGTPVPFVYGTMRVNQPTIVGKWNEARDQLGTESLGGRLWYRRADVLFSLGTPSWDAAGAPYFAWRATNPPKLLSMWIGNVKHTFANGGLTNGQSESVTLDLGGFGAGGNFRALIEFFDGRANQRLVAYPDPQTTAIGAAIVYGKNAGTIGGVADPHPGLNSSGYRHQMLVAMVMTAGPNGNLLGGSGTFGESSDILASFNFEVESLGPDPIGQDANPAWVAYDLMCSPVWKMGKDDADVDLASFTSAADLYVEEANGFSFALQSQTIVNDMIQMIGAQTDTLFFEDPTDSTIKAKPIRRDYVKASLPEMTQANTIGRPKITTIGWHDVATHVDAEFMSRSKGYKTDSAPAGRLANASDARSDGRKVSYPGCTMRTLALSLAARDLSVMGRPLSLCTAKLSREFHDISPGDALLANWPDYNITDKVFRVLHPGYGQLADGTVTATLIEDVFDATAGAFPESDATLYIPFLLPLHERYPTEAPYWMQQWLYNYGLIGSPDVQRLFAVAVNDDDTTATSFSVDGENLIVPGAFYTDVTGSSTFLQYATVAVDYPRTAEPYDITAGLELEDISAAAQVRLDTYTTTPTAGDIANNGYHLCMLLDPDTGAHEFIAFETYSADTLHNVWRGLLDTAARDWPAGSRFLLLNTQWVNHVGAVGRSADTIVRFVPSGGVLSGSGDDPFDTVDVIGRAASPLPCADFGIAGPLVEGTEGDPATGYLKLVTHLDADFRFEAAPRARSTTTITRGDAGYHSIESGNTFSLVAEKQNDGEDPEAEVAIAAGLATTILGGYLLGGAGHGTIDVKLRTENPFTGSSWTDPTIRVTAPSWRNLLANPAATSSFGAAAVNGWENVTGTVQASTGTSSLSRSATGNYFTSATASGSVTAFRQTVDVSGYPARGLSAIVDFYYRNLSADADDTITVLVEALDAASGSLSSSATSGALVGDVTLWKRASVAIAAMPALTARVRITVTMTGVSDGAPSTALSEISLRLGQVGSQLLSNPTFDAAVETLAFVMLCEGTASGISETGDTLTFLVTPTVGGGNQTSLSVSVTLDYPGLAGAAPTNTLNGWSTAGWVVVEDGDGHDIGWSATFTKATFSVGSSPTFSFTATAGSVIGTIIGDLTAGSSAEVPAATLTDCSRGVGEIVLSSTWDDADNTIVEDISTQFTITYDTNGFTPLNSTIVIDIATGATTSSPTTVSNTDGWTLSSWSAPGGGVQWRCTATHASGPGGGDGTLVFATTPSTAGSLGLSAAYDSQGIEQTSTTDTLTVTASFSVDATSSNGVPANSTEWTSAMSAAGIGSGNPMGLWLFQEASGDIDDKIGTADLTNSGYSYSQSVSGWTRTSLGIGTDGSGAICLNNSDSALPDLTSESALFLMYVAITSTPGAVRDIGGVGGGSSARSAHVTTGPYLRAHENGSSTNATGSSAMGTSVRPIVVRVDRATSTFTVYSDAEKVNLAWVAPASSAKLLYFGNAVLSAAPMKILYAALFKGAAAEMTATQIKTLLQTLGWTVSWTP